MQKLQKKKFSVFCSMLLTLAGPPSVWSQSLCNVCSALNGLACVSQTQFKVCDANNLPSGSVMSCPVGYVCSTATANICQVSSNNALTACVDCNRCDASLTFACTGPQTYALCLGLAAPSQITGSCAPDYVCSIDTPKICGQAILGVSATCSYYDNSTAVTTTTPAPPVTQDPNVFCQSMGQAGKFPVGNNVTSTCRQYYNCFSSNGLWSGATYICPGQTYFDSNTRLCNVTIPTRCLTTTAVLQISY